MDIATVPPDVSVGWMRTAVTRPLLIGLAAIGSLGSIVFNHVVSDRLGPAAANDVRAVSAGLSAVGFLAIGLQLSMVGWLGRFAGRHRLSASADRRFFTISALLGLLAGAFAAIIIDANTAYRVHTGLQVAIAIFATLVSVPPRAELLNGECWLRLGALMVVGPAFRVTFGVVMLSSHRTIINLIPITAAEILAALAAFALRPRRLPNVPINPPVHFVMKAALASLGLLITLVFSSVAFRSRLGNEADVFNESALVARAVLFAPLTILFLYFPAIARTPLGAPQLRRAYMTALGWTALLATVAAVALLIAPEPIGRLVTADTNSVSPIVVRLLAVAWALAAISIVSLLLYIAHGSRLSLTAWGAAIIIATGQFVANSAAQLATIVLLSSAALLIAVSVPAILRVQPILHARTAHPSDSRAVPRGDLALIVPCYNPGEAVVATIKTAHNHLSELGVRASIIVVCDGSSDGSADLVDALDLPMLSQIRHERNRGKGAALRTGFLHAHADFVAFIDADGDLSPQLLGSLLQAQQSFGADIVFGSKLHPDSNVHASHLRRLYSFGYQRLIRLLFQLDISDTQTGIKVFRYEVVDAVLPSLREEGFALDLELFIAARAAGFTNYVEVPVTLRRQSGSTISARAVRRMFSDTLRLFWRAKITLAYTRLASGSETMQMASPNVGVNTQLPASTG